MPMAAAPRDVAPTAEQLAAGMAHYLGLNDEDATSLAGEASARRLERRQQRYSGVVLDMRVKRARECLRQALRDGPCLLALPFSGAGLDFLHALAVDRGVPLVLIESPALGLLGADLGTTVSSLQRCHTREVIGYVRTQEPARAVVYVSFPELHALTPGTTNRATFLGQSCRLSVLEPLLCLYGLNMLFMPGHGEDLNDADFGVVSCDSASLAASAQPVTSLLRWLLEQLELSAVKAPANTFSWHHLYRASMHCYQIERDNGIKQLDAYFNAWRNSSAGMPEPTYRVAMSRIAALRELR